MAVGVTGDMMSELCWWDLVLEPVFVRKKRLALRILGRIAGMYNQRVERREERRKKRTKSSESVRYGTRFLGGERRRRHPSDPGKGA